MVPFLYASNPSEMFLKMGHKIYIPLLLSAKFLNPVLYLKGAIRLKSRFCTISIFVNISSKKEA